VNGTVHQKAEISKLSLYEKYSRCRVSQMMVYSVQIQERLKRRARLNATHESMHLEQPRNEGTVEPVAVLLVSLRRRLVSEESGLLAIDLVFAGVEVGGVGLDANCLVIPLEASDHAVIGQYLKIGLC
jgi:hypothetical protein